MNALIDPGPVTSEADWNRLLSRAINGEGLRALFQPIIDLQRCVVVGYEALTRFDLPGAQDVGPERWFAEAARSGVGAELDATALENVLRHRDSLPAHCFLTVNVDPLHLLEPCVQAVFAQHQDLAGIVVELTEHHAWEWSELAPTLDTLCRSGAIVAIDDAGAGHCGLQQILEVRPAIVKLDRSLVAGIDRDEAKVAMVEMMGAFSSRMDAWLLAEGVETRSEALCLFDLGVPLVQGFYFGAPCDPWVGIAEDVCRDFGGLTRVPQSASTLRRLVDPVEPLRRDEVQGYDWATTDTWKPVIDLHGRPIGVVDSRTACDEPVQAVIANIQSDPREVAHRVATAALEPNVPIVVIDELGTYRGIVTMRRLLRHLVGAPG